MYDAAVCVWQWVKCRNPNPNSVGKMQGCWMWLQQQVKCEIKMSG